MAACTNNQRAASGNDLVVAGKSVTPQCNIFSSSGFGHATDQQLLVTALQSETDRAARNSQQPSSNSTEKKKKQTDSKQKESNRTSRSSGGDEDDGHGDGDGGAAAAPQRKKQRRAKGCKSRPTEDQRSATRNAAGHSR